MRSLLVLVALVAAGSLTVPATTASAAAAPSVAAVPAAPDEGNAPVSADVLPTAQINGVAYKQVIVGNTVYVGGKFESARPAGVALGGAGQVTRSNMLAYNLSTGVLDPTFHPSFNGIIKDMAVTPDGSKLAVVGEFSQVDGVAHSRAVVFNLPSDGAASGATISTTVVPDLNGVAAGVAVTNTQLWVGGYFSAITNQPSGELMARNRVGAISLVDGSVLPVAPIIDDGQLFSLAISPDGSKVAMAGNFSTVNNGQSSPATGGGKGLYFASTSTGAGLPLPVNNEVFAYGNSAGFLRVESDSTSFYGTAWNYNGTGNTEGFFQASWADGSLINLEDCHGDTYDIAPVNGTIYIAGHQHQCLDSGGFPQTQPDPWNTFHSTAWTKSTEGTNLQNTYSGYWNHAGTPRPGLLHWFPQYVIGSYTGQNQATWTVAGNGQYVVYGGEFLAVDGINQQGLVRYATRSAAAKDVGPQTAANNVFSPTVHSNSSGTARVAWPPLWDRDDATLTYTVFRDSTSTPIYTGTQTTQQWDGQSMSFTDTGLTPGSTHQYAVRVTDGDGNVNNSSFTGVTIASAATLDPYGTKVLADGATTFWRLDDSGTAVGDSAGADNVSAGSGVSRGTAGAVLGSSDTASTFNGTQNGQVRSGNLVLAPDTFSIEGWFKTPVGSTTGGKIMSFGDSSSNTVVSAHYDRQIYLDSTGHVIFGVAPLGVRHTATSTAVYNDGSWHQVVATLGSGGMVLYVDGEKVGADGATTPATSGEHYGGYWRLGGDASWVSSSQRWFNGSIDDFSVYPTALSAIKVHNHYAAAGYTTAIDDPDPGNGGVNGGGSTTAAPKATFTTTAVGRNVTLRGTGTPASGATISSYSWNLGDGKTSVARNVLHKYAKAGVYTVTLTVKDNGGRIGTVTRKISVVNARPSAVLAASVHKKKVISFFATGSRDRDGRIVKYAWRFGDGKVATGATISHKFPKAKKRYLVTLTVTDDSGATTTTTRRVKTKK